ncbi:hypothetical protein Tco_0591978, partial [Tanacetum coccineum]
VQNRNPDQPQTYYTSDPPQLLTLGVSAPHNPILKALL